MLDTFAGVVVGHMYEVPVQRDEGVRFTEAIGTGEAPDGRLFDVSRTVSSDRIIVDVEGRRYAVGLRWIVAGILNIDKKRQIEGLIEEILAPPVDVSVLKEEGDDA